MKVIQLRPKLKDLSQGSRIAFVRRFRFVTQDYVSDKLGLTYVSCSPFRVPIARLAAAQAAIKQRTQK